MPICFWWNCTNLAKGLVSGKSLCKKHILSALRDRSKTQK